MGSIRQCIKILTSTVLLLTTLTVSAHAQKPDNTQPMCGETPKSEDYNKVDREFVESTVKKHRGVQNAVEFHLKSAWTYLINSDWQTAMKRFNQVWLLDPECPDAYFGFAALTEMQGRNEEARRFYAIGKEKDITGERSRECYQRIADCKEELGDIRGAISAYGRILELNPDEARAHRKLGFLTSCLDSFDNEFVIGCYSRAILLDPSDHVSYTNRGYHYALEGNIPLAMADYNKALEIDPEYIHAYVNRGILRMQSGEIASAGPDFISALRLDPKSGELHRFLGVQKMWSGDLAGAEKELKKAVKYGDGGAVHFLQMCKNEVKQRTAK